MSNKQASVHAHRTLLAAVLETRNYIVGEANAPSGLYCYEGETWHHAGWQNLRCTALATASGVLFLASGNGVLRSHDEGATWRVTTDWRVAEVLSVALDPFTPGSVYAATAFGMWRSLDQGDKWHALSSPSQRPDLTFTATLCFDRATPRRLLIGTADGLFESRDGGQAWQPVGPRLAMRTLKQSAVRAELWLAGTEGAGVLVSPDGGTTWSACGGEATIYAVALDPSDEKRMVAGGYKAGLLASNDGGTTWEQRPLTAPTQTLHALAFDPDHSGRLWLGTVGEGVFVTDDLGQTCIDAGLPETTVYDFAFGAV